MTHEVILFYVGALPFWFVAIRALIQAGIKADISAFLILVITGIVIGEFVSVFRFSSGASNRSITEFAWLSLFGGGFEEFLRATMVAFLLRKGPSEASERLTLAVAAVYSVAENVTGFSTEYGDLLSGDVSTDCSCFFRQYLLYCQESSVIILASLSQLLKFFQHFIFIFVSASSLLSRRFGVFFLVVFLHAVGNGIGSMIFAYPVFSGWMVQILLSLVKVTVLAALFSSFMRERGFVWTLFLRSLFFPTPRSLSSSPK